MDGVAPAKGNFIELSAREGHDTPPGFNKNRRDIVKWLLGFAVVTLLSNQFWLATILSGAAIVNLKSGTLFSVKNVKWMSLSVASFVASLTSWIMFNSSEAVDEDKAYTLKILLWLGAKSIQAFWGITLALFLFMATMTSKTATKDS